MRAIKRTVLEFQIGDLRMNEEEATELYRSLAEALGVPIIKHAPCSSRYSHQPHIEAVGKWFREFGYCGGRSQDAT